MESWVPIKALTSAHTRQVKTDRDLFCQSIVEGSIENIVYVYIILHVDDNVTCFVQM